jgi:hypothetical protein
VKNTLIGPALSGVVTIDIDHRIVALSPDRDHVMFLNQTASDVWRLADGGRTFDELVSELAAAYGTRPDAIADDVWQALASFSDSGLMANPV